MVAVDLGKLWPSFEIRAYSRHDNVCLGISLSIGLNIFLRLALGISDIVSANLQSRCTSYQI